MSAKHTPGPWACDGSHIYAPDGEIIAQVRNPGSKESDYPLVANRNLMVAAPEMLDALQNMLDLQDQMGIHETPEHYGEFLAQARAAIAKATGAQP